MGIGYTRYSCICEGEITEEWDHTSNYINCNKCDNPKPLTSVYIVGQAGSGKDYVTGIIKEIYPGYNSIAIAEPLYSLVECIKKYDENSFRAILRNLGLEYYQINMAWKKISKEMLDEVNDPFINKPRRTLQLLGDIIREFDIYSLIREAIGKVRGPAIITDVRLPLEGKALKSAGFLGIKVVAEEVIRFGRLKERDKVINISHLTHRTETEINNIFYDVVITNNDSTKDELTNQISNLIKSTIV